MSTTINGLEIGGVDKQYLRYFVYSAEQLKAFKEVHKKLGRTVIAPTVFVKGKKKAYTEMLRDPNKCKYSDYIIVAAGDIRKMKYTEWNMGDD